MTETSQMPSSTCQGSWAPIEILRLKKTNGGGEGPPLAIYGFGTRPDVSARSRAPRAASTPPGQPPTLDGVARLDLLAQSSPSRF